MGYLTDVAIGATGSLLAAEIWCHADPVARWLIRRGVSRLPEEERDRREEEWLAHLEETPGAVRKLLHGLGCWSCAPAIGRVLAPSRAQSASTSNLGAFRVARTFFTQRAVQGGMLGGIGGSTAAIAFQGPLFGAYGIPGNLWEMCALTAIYFAVSIPIGVIIINVLRRRSQHGASSRAPDER